MDDEFVKEIKELLALGYEGGYWDFKKEYTPFADDKLTDIICMANNLCNRVAPCKVFMSCGTCSSLVLASYASNCTLSSWYVTYL